MLSSIMTWVNSASAWVWHLFTPPESSPTFDHIVQMTELIHSMRVCIWLGTPFMICLALCNFCLNEGWLVIDASHFTPSPGHRIPSTPVSQGLTIHTAKGSPCFCWNCIPKSTNSTRIYGHYVMNSVTLGSLENVPPGCRLLMLQCFATKRGSMVS